MPELYIITGSNGAGKSTVGTTYLPTHIQQHCSVFDGDKLFIDKQRELWKSGIKAIKEAKKMPFAFVEECFDKLVEESLSRRSDFAYEGHFTNEATWAIPRKFKAAGFTIHMIYFGLSDTTLSELRVVDRAKEGGHYVDPVTISDNFYGNLEKLNQHFEIFNTLQIVDTSEPEHKLLAVFKNGEVESSVSLNELPKWVVDNLTNLVDKIREDVRGI
jgi:predicted ABC-type ATPase